MVKLAKTAERNDGGSEQERPNKTVSDQVDLHSFFLIFFKNIFLVSLADMEKSTRSFSSSVQAQSRKERPGTEESRK